MEALPAYYPCVHDIVGTPSEERMIVRVVLYALAALLAACSCGWGALALWYQFPGGAAARWAACLAWVAVAAGLLALAWTRRSGWPLLAYVGAFAALLAWWGTIRPSNQRDWADDVARLLTGTVDGDRITLHNVRDFAWRSNTDYDTRWEKRSYDLDQLTSADLILSSWGAPGIAHAMVSFGFDDGSRVAFSVEIRRERDEAFSSLGGFFREFELIIIAADERDIVRVRTNVRGEDDHLYPLQMDRPAMRTLFLSYVDEANRLARKPAFYNSLTSNCVIIVYRMAKQIDPGLPFDYRLLLTGYLPGYLYEAGALDRRYPLAVLTAQGDITARARAIGPNENFSRAIRTPPEPGTPDAAAR
jgi:hypothetical protein